MTLSVQREGLTLGRRYALHELIAAGGMGRVYFGRALGAAGFSRSVAIKRLHPNLASDPQFVAMLLDEARISSFIHHPNVVATLDVVAEDGEFLLVMEYVPGVSLHLLLDRARAASRIPPPEIVASVFSGILRGLHAAHEATNDAGEPLAIVHRDVSPQNVLVTENGSIKIVDFGVAKAQQRIVATQSNGIKGKPSYMAPEQLAGSPVDRRADIYAVGVMLWEAIVGARLFTSDRTHGHVDEWPRVATMSQSASAMCFAAVAERALSFDPDRRFATAAEMAVAIEAQAELASPGAVGAWATELASDWLIKQQSLVSRSRFAGVVVEAPASTVIAPSPALGSRSRSRLRRASLAGLVVALVTAAGVGLVARRWSFARATRTAEGAVLSGNATALGEPVPPAPPTRAETGSPASSEPPPATRPGASATGNGLTSMPAVAAKGSRSSGYRSPTRAAAVTTSSSSSSSSSACNPPFTVDTRGTKIPKRECL